ncbi:MAG: excisionase family DNA-binding protein [Litorivicinus sp.]
MKPMTAKALFDELTQLPISEQKEFMSLLAPANLLTPNRRYGMDEVFGDLDEQFFTSKEAANYLDVSTSTFRRHIRNGLLQADKTVGKSQLFRIGTVSTLKARLQRIKPQPPTE